MKFLAVANHAFKEALRKRILLILGFFFAVLVILSRSVEVVNPVDRPILVVRIVFAAMTFFGLLSALFLSATSLTKEIERKEIITVLTKPISRWQFLLGKNLGLSAACGLFLLLMSIFSLLSIHLISQGQDLTARRSFCSDKISVKGEGIIEREDIYWLKGPQAQATWSWQGLKKESLSGEGEINIRLVNITPSGGARRTEIILNYISGSDKGEFGRLTVEDEKTARFKIDPNWLDKDGSLQIELQSPNPDYALGVKTESIKICAWPGNFDLNFFKAVLLLFFEVILIIVVTVTGTTFLSVPVTICLGFFTLLAGHMIEFLKGVVRTIAAIGMMTAPHQHGHIEHHHEAQWLTNLLKIFLEWWTRLFPDLQRFEVSSSVVEQVDIPFFVVGKEFFYLGIYVIILYLISIVIFRFREFK